MEAGWAGTDLALFEVPSGSRGVRGENSALPLLCPRGTAFEQAIGSTSLTRTFDRSVLTRGDQHE